MKRENILACLVLSIISIAASPLLVGQALHAQIGGHLYSSGGEVRIKVLSARAGYTSELWLDSPGSRRWLGVTNRDVDSVVNVGTFSSGTELVFAIRMRDTGHYFRMGPGSRNPDGQPHARVTPLAPGKADVGFEDVFGGGDLDYDDNMFEFTGVLTFANWNVGSTSWVFIYPWETLSAKDDFAEVRRIYTVSPADRYILRLKTGDDFVGNAQDYRFKQVLLDGEVVWEQDVARGELEPQSIQVDVTKWVKGKFQVTMTLRVIDLRKVTNFGIVVVWGEVEAEGLSPAKGSAWKANTRGAWRTPFQRSPTPYDFYAVPMGPGRVVPMASVLSAPAGAGSKIDVKTVVKGRWTIFAFASAAKDKVSANTFRIPCVARDGSIWWGLEEGAVRYDGKTWTKYTSRDGLMDGAVRSIIQAEDGTLWFAGSHRGKAAVTSYDGRAWQTYSEADGLVGSYVGVASAIDRAGNLWLSTEHIGARDGNGVIRFDGKTWRNFRVEDGLAHNRVYDIAAGPDGSVWFATFQTYLGVSRFDGKSWTTYLDAPRNWTYRVFVAQDGKVWCIHGWNDRRWVSVFDRRAWRFVNEADKMPVRMVESISQTEDGAIWFGTHQNHLKTYGADIKGLLRYQDGAWLRILKEDGLPGDNVHSITQSKDGSLYLTVPDVGLVRYRPDFSELGTISGAVKRIDGAPWAWVGVRVEDEAGQTRTGATTDAEGRYQARMFAGTFRLSVIGGGRKAMASATVKAGEQVQNVDIIPETLHPEVKRQLKDIVHLASISKLSFDEITAMFSDLALVAEWERIHGLGEIGGSGFAQSAAQWRPTGIGDNLFKDGFDLVVEGVGLERVRSILENRLQSYLNRHEARYKMIIHGIGLVQGGANPYYIQRELQSLYYTSTERRIAINSDISVSELRRKLQLTPSSQLSLDDISEVFADFTIIARREGILALKEIPQLTKDEELLQNGLNLIISGVRPEQVQRSLETRMQTLLRDHRIRYRLIVEGFLAIRAGDSPRTVRYKLWFLKVKELYGAMALKGGIGLLLIGLGGTSGYAVKKHRDLRRAERALMQEMQKELQTAHEMQMALMPKESPRIEGLDIAGRCLPANHVGGDYFQYFSQDDRLTLSLADVTGHAMEAAIPVVMFSGLLKSHMELGGALQERFDRLNRSLYGTLTGRTLVCLTMGELDLGTRTLSLSDSGCPYPYHYRAATGEVAELQADAYPLGVRPDTAYQVVEVRLEAGDRVVLCSDGVAEAVNGVGEQFGYERTAEAIRGACEEGLSAEATIDRILGAVNAFRGDAPQADDMTCVVLGVDREGREEGERRETAPRLTGMKTE